MLLEGRLGHSRPQPSHSIPSVEQDETFARRERPEILPQARSASFTTSRTATLPDRGPVPHFDFQHSAHSPRQLWVLCRLRQPERQPGATPGRFLRPDTSAHCLQELLGQMQS